MLFDQVAASMPQEGVLAHTEARMREIRAKVYSKPAPYQAPVIVKPKPLPAPRVNPINEWVTSLRFALEVLHNKVGDGRFVPPKTSCKQLSDILKEVSEKHGVAIDQIKKIDGYASRKHLITIARQEFFYLACKEELYSLPRIGRYIGGFDHTTVLHGRKAHAKRMEGGDI